MHNTLRSALLFSCCLLLSFQLSAEPADTVYLNGRIYTSNAAQPWVEAVAIKGERFIYVGDSEGARKYIGSATLSHDLAGKMAMPGIHDAHSHMLWGGLNKLFECRLPLAATVDALITKLKACGSEQAPSEWIIAGSAWSEQFPGDRFHRSILDAAFPDTPVFIVEGSQHNAFVNSKGLEVAGITEATADPRGGRLVRDSSGKLTGELVETATVLASKDFKAAPAEQRLEALRWASRLFSQYGITSTQEASANAEVLATLDELDKQQQLQQLVAAHIIWGSPKFAHSTVAEMEKLIEQRHQYASKHVKMDFVKMWIDGSPTPPYFTESNMDPLSGKVDLKNILIPPAELNAIVTRLDKQGIKVKMHVAGAGAAHVALDAVAAARKANPDSKIMHELGHTNLVVPADFPRMKQLNVSADMSPTIWHLYGPTLGNPPLPAWQFRTLHENGVLMSIGTDWPVTDDPNVFPAIQGLLDRGYESLDLDTALQMLTINGARALGWERELGSIESGKLANFIVLDRNLFAVAKTEIGATRVLQTVFEGRVVYQQSAD